mmetsp:Transcript_16341/g.44352  ORF Transcript_16341/g.44352 Transcript_16341/m.44352 type:complete len:736 (-) Transcript_16341:332-2539(-)
MTTERAQAMSLQPKQDATLGTAFQRLRKKATLKDTVKITLTTNAGQENEINEESLNKDAWKSARAINFIDDGNEYQFPIHYNPPFLKSISIGRRHLVGCVLVPRLELEFSSPEHARVVWKRCHQFDPTSTTTTVATGPSYVPTAADVGASILCEVTPHPHPSSPHLPPGAPGTTGALGEFKRSALEAPNPSKRAPNTRGGPAASKATTDGSPADADVPVVEAFPDEAWPFAGRLAPPARNEGALRVCSYNLLCDHFCDCEWGRTCLYPYCPPAALSGHYRARLQLRELEHYDADLLCLQEVTSTSFYSYLEPALALRGYRAWFTARSRSSWGLCMAWKAEYFEERASRVLQLSDRAEWSAAPHVVAMADQWPEMKDAMSRSGTIAQVALLRWKRAAGDDAGSAEGEERLLAVSNSHLFGNPDGPHIRIVQSALIAASLERLAAQHAAQDQGRAPPFVLVCGDTNASRDSGAMEFLESGEVKRTHPDWAEGMCYRNLVTKDEREEHWHAGLTPDEHAEQRRAFVALASRPQDPPCSADRVLEGGQLDAKLLHKLLVRASLEAPPRRSTDADAIEFTVAGDEDAAESQAAADLAAAVAAGDEDGSVCYAGWFALAQGMKARNGEGYSHWIRAVAASPPIPAWVGAEPQATGTKAAGPATERLKGLDLRHGLGLSIASSVEGATFSAGGKRALVDFILQRGFEARAAPALDERHWGGGIPTATVPSDHLAIIVDLQAK